MEKEQKSIEEVRSLCSKAKQAQLVYREFDQARVNRIVAAMADAGFQASVQLAKLAVEETGYGNVPDKIKKNQFATRDLYNSIKDLKTVGVISEDRHKKIFEIAEPMGIVAAIIPTTNPTSTAMFKVIISLKARNGVILSPHPRALRCTLASAKILAEAAVTAGAPDGLISTLTSASLRATTELMRHPDVDVILATGGAGLVRAAYSSGKPAYGVGPGNVPAYIDRSAQVKKAVADIVTGKTFDFGTLCSSEQALIAEAQLKSHVLDELQKNGAHIMTPAEIDQLQKVLVTEDFRINAELVGKSAPHLAKNAGFSVPENTRLLVAELQGVGKKYPLSAEKLSPTLALFIVQDREQAIQRAIEILNFGGRGHTAAIHARNDGIIREFGLRVPASRVVVNSPASMGSVGYTNSLVPSMTLGCGSYGRNITSDNISAHHLLNIKRVAYETTPMSRKRDDLQWRTRFEQDWRHKEAPYTKAFSSAVWQKSKAGATQNPDSTIQDRKYGSSGLCDSEVEQMVRDFQKSQKQQD